MTSLMSSLRQRIARARRMATMGAGRLHQAKLVLITNWYPLLRRIGSPQWPPVVVSLREADQVLDLRVTSAADLLVLEEVFIRRDYDVRLRRSPNTILDLGANFGASVAFFAARFPHSTILAFEPAARTFEQLQQNTRRLANVRVFREAVAGVTGEATLHSAPARSAGASLMPREKNTQTESVPTISLDELLEREHLDWVDLVKFDVEGSEVELFRNSKRRQRIGELIGEYHPDLTRIELAEFLALFPDFACTTVPAPSGRCLVHLVNPAIIAA